MDWTSDIIEQFISEIKTRPAIWDSCHVDYKNRNKKHDALVEIGLLFNCDSSEVMRKYKIILSQYRREKRKILDSETSGSSRVYKPRWFGYKHMIFLHDRDEPSNTINTIEDTTEQLPHNVKARITKEVSDEVKKKLFKSKRVRKSSVEEDSRTSNSFQVMENVITIHDEDELFAAGIASKLKKIKNEHIKILVQRDIDNMLYDAIIGIGKYDATTMPSSRSQTWKSSPHSHASPSQVRMPIITVINPNVNNNEELWSDE